MSKAIVIGDGLSIEEYQERVYDLEEALKHISRCCSILYHDATIAEIRRIAEEALNG